MFRPLSVIAFTLCLSALSLGTTYHVAQSGKDTNPGTADKPFKTIQHGIDLAAAGDTILVHTGKYVGRAIIHKPLTLMAASGEKPIIDGTGVAVPEDGSGLVLIENTHDVTVKGFTVRNYKTSSSTLVPIGIFVQGTGDNIQILNNFVTKIETNGTNANTINAFGIAVYANSKEGPITNLVIDGNEVSYTKTGSSETVTVNGNVDGFRVTNNHVHDVNNIGIVCIGYENTSPIEGKDYARNGLVADNTVSSVSSLKNPAYHGERGADGIYVDGGADIVIERNNVRTSDIGIEVTSEHNGRNASGVIVRSNLLTANYVVGLSIGGYARSKGGTKNCTFVNNTFYQNDTTKSSSGEFQVQFNTADNIFKNNILVASKQGVLISSLNGANSSVGVVSDYNVYYAPANLSWRWNSHNYTSLAAFVAGTGNDAHSTFALPKFVNPTTGNFRLQDGSAGIDSGQNLGPDVLGLMDLDGNTRVQGSQVDDGCYERMVS
ncbi:right-handed parallel beta-helix repeat-containing protein [soil metagenome]